MNDDAAAATGQQVTAASYDVDAILENDPDFFRRVHSGARSYDRTRRVGRDYRDRSTRIGLRSNTE